MKSELLTAINALAAEKNLPRDVVLHTAEQALASALKKDNAAFPQALAVKINPVTGELKVLIPKEVKEQVTDPRREISLEEAHHLSPHAGIGDQVEVPIALPESAGRIAAQTAKQVLLQRLKEAEYTALFDEFHAREGDVVSATIQRVEPKQAYLGMGRGEGVLPVTEQVRSERLRSGQRLKVYLMEVQRTSRGTQVVVSRTHKNLLRRLLELEVPEIQQGVVEIKAIAREAGSRSKVAVVANQEGVDPVGSCVGQRGIRIQGIVRELGGERVDVVVWDTNPAVFIANALSPAQVLSVQVKDGEKTAQVVVPDRQLSLAIGKEGQNARLAAKLTGWRIDIKSASVAGVQKVAAAPALQEAQAPEAVAAPPPAPISPLQPASVAVPEPEREAVPAGVVSQGVALPAAEPAPAEAEEKEPVEALSFEELFAPKVAAEKTGIRFAEDIPELRRGRGKGKREEEAKGKKAKKRETPYATEEEL